MSTVVVVGNPRPRSRTHAAAVAVAQGVTGEEPDVVLDLADLGAALLDWSSTEVASALEQVVAADLLVVASPTYKATYTGLLKLFLDRVPTGGLTGVAVPVMLGGDHRHSLAVELHLKPLLAELGASTPTTGLFLLEAEGAAGSVAQAWLERWRDVLVSATAGRARAPRP